MALGVVLVLGIVAVRAGRIRLHKYLQSCVVLGNLPVVLTTMVPQYVAIVLPQISGRWAEPSNLLPTAMLVLGAIAESLGVYILLVAGTDWLPERWRFRRYRWWMWAETLLWWTVLAVGLSVYVVWYA